MPIENVLTITGRGTVVTGAVERGTVRVGDAGRGGRAVGPTRRPSVVTGSETFGKSLARAEAGDNAALLLRGVNRDQVRRGQVVAAPGSVRPHRRFTAHAVRCCPRPRVAGTRRSLADYRPQFYFRTTDVSGGSTWAARVARPRSRPATRCDHGRARQAGRAGRRPGFAVREGGRTVGAGTVTALLD